jgi:hypothetical protein
MRKKNKKVLSEEISCPICGYYCLGKGGFGCIDKPKLVEIEKSNLSKSNS